MKIKTIEDLIKTSIILGTAIGVFTKEPLFNKMAIGLAMPYLIYALNKEMWKSYEIGLQIKNDLLTKDNYKK